MSENYSVLVVDDEESIRKLFEKEFSRPERTIHSAASAAQARQLTRRNLYDVVILDIRLPDADGLDLFTEFKERLQDVEIILITGHGNIDSAVQAMKLGAYDYITKPFNLDKLELVIERAWQRACMQRENRSFRLSSESRKVHRMVGNSESIKQVRYLVGRVAPTEVPVLLTGESGVGKDVAAQAIHSGSRRADKPFIIKNCAALVKELARSELFGHIKGSFTGATESREGLMAFAHKGTLFLDEIGELPLEVQASLLRVLENKTYRRVGDKDERTIDIRFIFATSRNLHVEVEEGRFQEALLHRINVFNIETPPLRERKEDIPMLVEHFLASLSNTPTRYRITDKAMHCLLSYSWPGNVRELRNVLERSMILSDEGIITERALPRELVEHSLAHGDILAGDKGVFSLRTVERDHISRVLNYFEGNRHQASKAMGIGRKTLYRKLKEYELD
ncbi:two-component system, NtrC family, response regulator [Desulfonatronum thiosulfatophilum]|uniref:Two-component system, NtrC family, response regulator n=1 Tax=Desulfonatronum thiosulfatophilum TaxID=617002 RepID=A0A1G6B072_9BACT|nr:sigma-54 dependent transcriptional regulator [Desulfonatronum thiosulfatophilum]SDB13945.1 two-component system, NtrC family, response regulator [Desulfonatronum thiosulfatophilum]